MKRGMSRGRGNRIISGGQHNVRPFVGDMGLQDLDMELELLKRKREIIEEQQLMLSSSFRQRNDFESSFNDSRDYDDGSYDSNYGGGGSRKRNIPVWENEPPTKRFSAPSGSGSSRGGPSPRRGGSGVSRGGSGSSRGGSNSGRGGPGSSRGGSSQRGSALNRGAKSSRPGPSPNQSSESSSLQAPAKPWRRPPPPHKKKNFNPTKVSKPSAPPALMSLDNYTPAERKHLVAEAAKLTTRTRPRKSYLENDDEWILRSDREPNVKVNGRLELALGSIMKDLKMANAEYEELFVAQGSQRAMKQVVRERIKNAMIGKKVGHPDEIKAAYLELYPNSHDSHVIMRGLESRPGQPFVPIPSDNPEVYFKKNMNRLIVLKMEQMFKKIENIYFPTPPANPKKKFQHRPRVEREQSAENKEDSESKPENTDQDEPKTDTIQDTAATVEIKQDEKTDAEKVTSGNTDEEINKETDTTGNTTESVTTDDANKKEPDNLTKTYEEDIISTDKYIAYDRFLTIKMLQLLKKFTPKIIKMMDLDNTYRKFEISVREETRKMLRGAHKPSQSQSGPSEVNPAPKTFAPLPYFVKLMGKPSLPKRKAMESFFETYKPKLIKKHKSVHNLLFVGFADKESFDNILAASGTVIGRNKLDIIVSERNFTKEPKKQNTDNAEKKNDADVKKDNTEGVVKEGKDGDKKSDINPTVQEKLDNSSEHLIGSDLDEQITDLLSSIRKAEENPENSSDDVVLSEPQTTADKTNSDVKKHDETTTNDVTKDKNDVIEIQDDVVEIQDDVTEIKDDVTEIKDDVTEVENDVVEIQDDVTEVQNNTEIEETTKNNEDLSSGIIDDMLSDIKGDNNVQELSEGNGKTAEITNEENDDINNGSEANNECEVTEAEESEKKDSVSKLKTKAEVKPTPTRSSARLTRRTSTLQ